METRRELIQDNNKSSTRTTVKGEKKQAFLHSIVLNSSTYEFLTRGSCTRGRTICLPSIAATWRIGSAPASKASERQQQERKKKRKEEKTWRLESNVVITTRRKRGTR
ncbi:hypothetical protein CEXT_352441 [Caerostris extrusa]|uniref:Uncharacterized protein n=1 Tax=Caerostris extrusa TaxID=172846 RepID=A0AAV4XD99_CAEEX|nr:hypothetical protein CEXT_352441 [Caerostris extrusa]